VQVTTLRQELEDFLKDDDDMAKMCLSRKRDQATQWAAANAQGSSPSAHPVPCIAANHPSLQDPVCRFSMSSDLMPGSGAGNARLTQTVVNVGSLSK